MERIIVIGCPGSGKSTFSKKLHKITKTPLFHLDMMFWNADKTNVSREVFLERLNGVLLKEQWIIDGNYSSSMELRLQNCDTVFFLDYPAELCLEGINERRGKPRKDIPWVENEEDSEFTEFVKSFNTQSRPEVLKLLDKYSHKDIHIFKSRNEADEFLDQISL